MGAAHVVRAVNRVDAVDNGNAEPRLLRGSLNLTDDLVPVVHRHRLIGDVENRADPVLHHGLIEFLGIDLQVLIAA